MDTLPTWARRRRYRSSKPTHPLLLCAVLVLLTSAPLTHAFWFLPEKRFRYQGLIDAGSLGLHDVGSGIAAWGDWDGDQYLDAFLLSDDHKTLELRLWDHTEFTYSEKPLFSISPRSGDPIVNVIPSDFDRDGRLDLLLMTQSAKGAEIQMEVWLGKGREQGGIEAAPWSVPSSTSAQPVLLDGTGDMRMDLLGHASAQGSGSSTDGGQPLVMWENIFSSSNSSHEAFQIASAPLRDGKEQEHPCTLAEPHSSAFVDLNGDCMADLFLVCAPAHGSRRNRYQIWTATQDATASKNKGNPTAAPGGFVFSRSGELPEGAGPLSFADMNRDGTIDVVFVSCNASDCYINVAYNNQIGLCDKKVTATGNVETPKSWKDWWFGNDDGRGSGAAGERCRETERLCVADDSFSFDFDGKQSKSSLLQVPFSMLLPGHTPLMEDKLAGTPSAQPVPLVIGDFNKDGYPDILLLTIPPKAPSDGTGKTSVSILKNQRCSALSSAKARQACERASPSADEEARWFAQVQDGAAVLSGMSDVRSAAWIDLDDDGSLDVVLQRGGRSAVRTVTFVQNNYFYDAFFLKALTLNGACASTCEARSPTAGGAVEKYKPWGASLPGASYKFTVLDTNGNRRAQQVGQLPQSAYRALLTPYSYFGLGRTNNYVEKLFVGSTLQGDGYYLSMEGVIPNSQVVISPYHQGGRGGEQPAWHRELYLQPGDWIPWVTLVLFTLILALCGFVFAMHLNEKREDERERKRAVHAINFDALG